MSFFFFIIILSPVHVVADRWLVMDGTSTLKSQLMLFSPGVKKDIAFLQLLILNAQIKPL